jgi:hypothetical protein
VFEKDIGKTHASKRRPIRSCLLPDPGLKEGQAFPLWTIQ